VLGELTHVKDSLVIGPLPSAAIKGTKRFAQCVDARKSVDVCGVGTRNVGVKTRYCPKFLLEEIARCLGHSAVGLVVFIVLHGSTRIGEVFGEKRVVVSHMPCCHCCAVYCRFCQPETGEGKQQYQKASTHLGVTL